VPNFGDWRAGDIVLVHRTPNAVGYAIQASQAASFSPITRAGSICSHVAIYVGDGNVIDATPSLGVALQSVWNHCQNRPIQLRRLADPSIPPTDIADIAACAQTHIGKSYSLLQAVTSKVYPGTVPIPASLYCSTLVGLVVTEATGIELSSDPLHQPLHPVTLAAHPDLVDVLLEWRQL
jgi:cell wall-associated NlpC family hydrolase